MPDLSPQTGDNTTGIAVLGGYVTVVLASSANRDLVTAEIDKLTALIPTLDAPAQSGGGMLDKMDPVASAHMLVELAALKAVITGP